MSSGHLQLDQIELRQPSIVIKDETPNRLQSVRGSRRTRLTDLHNLGTDLFKGTSGTRATPQLVGPSRVPAAAMGFSLTPLASLCLGVAKGWINVARRGKGGQIDEEGTAWTRLPAEELKDQLAREFLVEVSTRSVQRALKELEDRNQIRREQRWKHRYRRDYWYAVTEQQEALEAMRPRTIAGNYQSQRTKPRSQVQATRVSSHPHILSTHGSKTHFSKIENQKQKKTHLNAVATCMAKGKQEPSGSIPSGSANTKRADQRPLKPLRSNAGKGFGAQQKSSDLDLQVIRSITGAQKQRVVKQVWVGDRCYEVADDPRTSPIK